MVVVAEDVLAVILTLRLEVSLGDENTGMEDTSCAEVAKGRDEGDA